MLRANVRKLDTILITHTHNDHVIGLDDVRPFNFSSKRSIRVYGLRTHLDEIKERFNYVFQSNPYPGAPKINLCPIEPFVSFEVDGIEILPIPLKHGSLDVLGYRILDKAYLTDTNHISAESLSRLENLEVLVLDALHHEEHHSHFNLKQSIEVAQGINSERTFLIHLSHRMGLHDQIDRECPPNIHLAYDGLTI